MKKRHIIRSVLFFMCIATLPAGDIASFVNLGFSTDSRFYMFGQYGIDSASSEAYGELYLVDVAKNEFAPGGAITKTYPMKLEPGQTGSGALLNLLSEHNELVKRNRIDHLRQGRFLYILVNGEPPKSELEFRDFVSGFTYRVNLIQSSLGSGNGVRASFYIQLSILDTSGRIKAYTVGLPNFMREGVRQYRIKQILLSPDERSLVFVIEKETGRQQDASIRYMVETVTIQ